MYVPGSVGWRMRRERGKETNESVRRRKRRKGERGRTNGPREDRGRRRRRERVFGTRLSCEGRIEEGGSESFGPFFLWISGWVGWGGLFSKKKEEEED